MINAFHRSFCQNSFFKMPKHISIASNLCELLFFAEFEEGFLTQIFRILIPHSS